MTRSVSQASIRNFQTPRRLCNVYSSAKVEYRVYRPNSLVKRLDTHQVSNINIDGFIRDSTIQSDVRRFCTTYKLEDFGSLSAFRTTCHPIRMPICPLFHPSGRLAIPSGRPTDQASSVRTMYISVRTFTVSRSYCSSLHPSGRLSSPFGRLSVIDQLQILSKFNLREDCFNHTDDVDSRPDALIHKERITIQISPSGRQSA
jgi:hypothetical protein